MIKPNDKEYFYKYYSPRSSKLVLANSSRKWSSPLEFNDPFDNQFDLHIDEDRVGLAQNIFDKLISVISRDEPIPNFRSSPMAAQMEIVRRTMGRLVGKFSANDNKEILEAAKEGVDRMVASTPEVNREIRSALIGTIVLCLTETHDNLLMWAHYAENHTGAVVKFLNVQEVGSPLLTAQKVSYSNEMPGWSFENIFDNQKFTEEMINRITLTKGMDWAYEKEWRVVTFLKDKSTTSVVWTFKPEELGAVYLGCKMTDEDKREIIEITAKNYPNAEIYQAIKHEREFKLVFERVR